MTDITLVLKALVYVAEFVIMAFVIPWLKTKLDAEKRDKLLDLIEIAVSAAEQIAEKAGFNGEAKKKYVVDFLMSKGYTIDDTLNNAIEAAVIDLHTAIGK